MVEENLVKKTCKELGITQKELAEKIGLTDRTLSKYATTHSPPKNVVNHINTLLENIEYKQIFKDLQKPIQKLHEVTNRI